MTRPNLTQSVHCAMGNLVARKNLVGQPGWSIDQHIGRVRGGLRNVSACFVIIGPDPFGRLPGSFSLHRSPLANRLDRGIKTMPSLLRKTGAALRNLTANWVHSIGDSK
jgi:hypothetical protein